jgi:hypothetical protein
MAHHDRTCPGTRSETLEPKWRISLNFYTGYEHLAMRHTEHRSLPVPVRGARR